MYHKKLNSKIKHFSEQVSNNSETVENDKLT